jgi:DNA-directed RNA polymerase subunit RPC12/RpoP
MSELKANVEVSSFVVYEYKWICPKCGVEMIVNLNDRVEQYIKCKGCHQILYREAPGLYSSKKQG